MRKSNLKAGLERVLERPAVQFNANKKWNNQKAWPFWYPFVPYPYLDTDWRNNGLGLLGFPVPPGRILDIPVTLEQDTVFRLLNLKYSLYREAPGAALTGTIEATAGSTTLTGTLTVFTTEAPAGTPLIWVNDNGTYSSGVVASVTNDTTLILEQAPTVATAAGAALFLRQLLWYDTVPNKQNTAIADLTGTISIAAGGTAVVGVLTLFTAELNAGDVFQVTDDAGIVRNFMVDTITNDLAMDVTETLSATVGVAAGATFRLIGNVLPSGGTVTLTGANNLVTGAGTDFVTDVTMGDTLYVPDAAGVVQGLRADAVISTTLLKFTQPLSNSGAGANMAVGVSTSAASPVPSSIFTYYPLTSFVRATLLFPSLRGRYSYGGTQKYLIQTQGLRERPRLITDLQGIDDGLGQVRSEALLPSEGGVQMRITNNFSETIIVNGELFGYKIALDGKE